MKKKTLLIIMCLLICGLSSAQKLPKERKVWQPEYIANTDKPQPDWDRSQKWQDWAVAKIKNNDFGKESSIVWKVYSDRDNNKTYSEPSSSSAVLPTTLGFMDMFYVADVRNGFALLYTSYFTGKEIEDAKCFGWIPVDNLLLWEECPRTHNKIYQKALVVHDPVKNSSIPEKSPPFLRQPNKTAAENRNQRAKDLDIYFIMKTTIVGDTKYYLLSTGMLVSGRKQTVYGWMPEEYITEWNNRLLIEPTFASKIVDYYKSKNLYPTIFNSREDARQLWTNDKIQNPLWQYSAFSTKRMHEHLMRTPIASDGEIAKDMYRVTTVSSLSSQKKDPEQQKKIEEMKQATDNINVIFVIDATSSMKNYYNSIAVALRKIMNRVYEYPMKTGVVLYKDYSDPDRITVQKLTYNIDEVYKFMEKNKEAIRFDEESDYSAMFLGLETALDAKRMLYDKNHTNFIILIGDAANHRTDPNGIKWQDKVEQLSQKMIDNRINFIAYQVNNNGSNACEDFGMHIGKLQIELLHKLKDKMGSDELMYKLKTNRFYGLSRKSNSVRLPVYNTYKFATSGESETIDGLQEIIFVNIDHFQNFVSEQLTMLETNFIDAAANETGYYDEDILRETMRLYGWKEADINSYIAYLKDGGSAKVSGYATVKTDRAPKGYQLFDYVLFFSQDELEDIIQHLNKINSSYAVHDGKAFQQAIVRIGQAMLGQFHENEIREWDMDKLLGQIYGIPVTLNLCGLDIMRLPYLGKEEYKEYIDVFKDKLENLKRIAGSSDYNGRFQRNGITYYWIPMNDMPGVYEDCDELKK